MDLLDELGDLPTVRRTFKAASKEIDFTQFSIFQDATQEVSQSTQVIEQEKSSSFGLLGIDSGFIGAVMKRLNGEKEETTEKAIDTEDEATPEIEPRERDKTQHTPIIEKPVIEVPTTQQADEILRADSDEAEGHEDTQEFVPDRQINPEDDIIAAIPDYDKLSVQDKIQARINEKRRRRELAEQQKEAPVPVAVREERKKAINPLVEVVKQNELIKKSAFTVKKQNASKFDPKKLVEEFMDSDEDPFSQTARDTPQTSPKADNPPEAAELQKGEMVELDSDSDDDLAQIKFGASKKSVFEVRRKLCRKARPPPVTLKKLIREEKRRQMQALGRKHVEVVVEEKEDEIMKMMQDEIERNKRLRERERDAAERRKREKERLLKGEISEDESDLDYDGEEEEEEEEAEDEQEETEEREERKEQEEQEEQDAGEMARSTDPPKSPAITFELQTQDVSSKTFGPLSLSDAFDQTLPKKYDGMSSLDVMKRLGEAADETMNTSISETTDRQDESAAVTENFQLGTLPVDEPDVPKTILESQNFLPDTQDDESEAVREAVREAKRLAEQKRRHRERELQSKGLNQIMENEAEESEDEWQGMGGRDGEISDEENSEDEKMLNDAAIDVNSDAIREALLRNEVAADDEMVKKIYKDIKTGAFRKRRARDGAYELELSDDEDQQILEYYNRRRLEQQRQQMMQSKDVKELAKDSNRKAFFDTIMETEESSYQFEEEPEDPEEEENGGEHDDDEETLVMPKRRKITRDQVRSMISFLEDEEKPQDAIYIDDDGHEEIKQMRESSVVLAERTETRRVEVREEDEDEDFGILARKSITSSFRMSSLKRERKAHEVNVTTSSKTVGDGRGAVTFLTKAPRLLKPKEARIEQTLHKRQLKVKGGEWKTE
ncbi:hypothetical protein KL923_000512 [Ogataea haglerorum]|nr:hypothetical protein KL923_000512 [Ogataea haglerorum]